MREWPAMGASVREKFDAVRDLDWPLPDDATAADHVRRRFLEGWDLTGDVIAEEFNASVPFLAQQVSQMRRLGYEFENTTIERQGRPNTTSYRLLNPKHEPNWEKHVPKTTRKKRTPSEKPDAVRKRESRAMAKAAQTNGHEAPAMPTLPRLGDAVEVSLLALGKDGDVRVGIRLNGQSWLLRLEGATSE